MAPLGDVDDGEWEIASGDGDALTLPPAIETAEREALLAQFVARFKDDQGHPIAQSAAQALKLARELGRFGIRVNAVAPAAVETEGMSQFFGDKKEDAVRAVVAGQSIRRVLRTDDLVGTILYLASDASSMVTGQTIAVDGGTVSL